MKEAHKRERFDKLLYRSKNIKPVKFKILGKDKICQGMPNGVSPNSERCLGEIDYKNKKVGIWPSDHFAISVVLKL